MRPELDPKRADGNELLERFLLHGDVGKTDGIVKRRAFMPPSSGRLSVYRTDACSQAELWSIYADHVRPYRGDESLGTARLVANSIYDKHLHVEPDGVPHWRHANVVNWPEEKEQQKAVALDLAKNSRFIPRP
jgi:hypothetical protein